MIRPRDRRDAAGPPACVLVVDDDAPVRSLLAAALTRAGYWVETAPDGTAALTALAPLLAPTGDGDGLENAEVGFDLVLLDLVMPAPDGAETLRRVRERFAPDELPVVMLSGVEESDAVVAALAAGANDFVPKPVDLPILLARVRAQVTLRRQASDLRRSAERMRRELEAAARVQRASLPDVALAFPDPASGPYRFAWAFEPCERVSGDGLGVSRLSDRHVAFHVLDAEGHGVRAGLVAASIGGLLLPAAGESAVVSEPVGLLSRDVTRLLDPDTAVRPAEVAARLARRFRDGAAGESLVTLLYGLLDVETGEVGYASAGHPPPVLLPAGGRPRRLERGGLPVGAHGRLEPQYADLSVVLAPGDRLVAYTDGVTEARSPAGELFGADRLLAALGSAGPSVRDAAEAAVAAAAAWSAGKADDDRTVLVVGRDSIGG